MATRTFNLSILALAYLETKSKPLRGNYSLALEQIIQEHRLGDSAIRKRESLARLRESTAVLKDLDIEPEAILSWVKAIVDPQGVPDE